MSEAKHYKDFLKVGHLYELNLERRPHRGIYLADERIEHGDIVMYLGNRGFILPNGKIRFKSFDEDSCLAKSITEFFEEVK